MNMQRKEGLLQQQDLNQGKKCLIFGLMKIRIKKIQIKQCCLNKEFIMEKDIKERLIKICERWVGITKDSETIKQKM